MKRLNLYIVLLSLASAIAFTVLLQEDTRPTQGYTSGGFVGDLKKDPTQPQP